MYKQTRLQCGNYYQSIAALIIVVCICGVAGCDNQSQELTSPKTTSTSNACDGARMASDVYVNNLIKDDRIALWNESEIDSFHNEKAFNENLNKIYLVEGNLLEANFKIDEIGVKTNLDGEKVTACKFWYAVRTTKYELGSRFLGVEVVTTDSQPMIDSYSIVSFPLGLPEDLK